MRKLTWTRVGAGALLVTSLLLTGAQSSCKSPPSHDPTAPPKPVNRGVVVKKERAHGWQIDNHVWCRKNGVTYRYRINDVYWDELKVGGRCMLP